MSNDYLDDDLEDGDLEDDLESGSLADYVQLSEEYLLGELGKAKRQGKGRKARKIGKAIKVKRKARRMGVPASRLVRKGRRGRGDTSVTECPETGVKLSGKQGLYVSEPQGCVPVSPTPQPLYDVEQLKSSQTADVTFFATPLGQTSSVGDTSFSKTDFHTNMTQSKVLPSPQQYALEGMSWYCSAGGADANGARDFTNLRANVVLQFYLGTNVHVQVPLMSVPQYAPAAYSYDGASTGNDSGWCVNPIPFYDFRVLNPGTGVKEPIRIKAQESFHVKAKFAAATTVTTDLKFGIVLHGTLFKEIR